MIFIRATEEQSRTVGIQDDNESIHLEGKTQTSTKMNENKVNDDMKDEFYLLLWWSFTCLGMFRSPLST